MITTTLGTPRLAAPVRTQSLQVVSDLCRDSSTVIAWGTQVDDEFDMDNEERAVWRVLVVVRDTLTEIHRPERRR